MSAQLSSSARSCSCKNYLPLLRKRKIQWFLSRISLYETKGCDLLEAIDFAIDDCLVEGIFYPLFMHRREEIKELLLQQFPVAFTHYLYFFTEHSLVE
ncbi:MAG: hypothetical protein HFG51_04900 [Lachnospiraceae bacterium]|nr:hypothetical protein [Lachnospiraceae bacterium]